MTDALRDLRVRANGLNHHLVEHPGDGRGTVLLLHGYLDMARTFTRVIRALGAHGFRVIAPDFRGHGESDRAPEGSYYHFADYLADVVGLLDALELPAVHVVAHSMGGSVATWLAGTFPRRVSSLALLEGVGPPAMPAEVTPDRTAAWIDGVAKVRARGARRIGSLDEVHVRMKVSNSDVPDEVLREMARYAVRAVEGGYEFRFDPLHQTMSPGRFDAEGFEAYIDRIACPVVHVWGRDPAGFELYAERARRYKNAQSVTLPDAGHMMHWTQPEALTRALVDFLDASSGQGGA